MYVQRNAQGQIVGAYVNQQNGYAEELISDTDQTLIAFLAPKPPLDLSNIDNLEKTFKALGLLLRDYCNQLQAGTYTQKTVAQLKSDFAAKYAALP